MDLESLQAALEAFGWRRAGDVLGSPTGDVWITAEDLALTDTCQLYASMARRAESALRHGSIGACDEYRTLLLALSVDPHVHMMLAQHGAARTVFEAWAQKHGMSLRFWDFSRASIRAEARHPVGGIVCVEWIGADPPSLFLYHWIDDGLRRVRSSWRDMLEARSAEGGKLLQQLEDVAVRLVAERLPETYATSDLAADTQGTGDDYLQNLEVLR